MPTTAEAKGACFHTPCPILMITMLLFMTAPYKQNALAGFCWVGATTRIPNACAPEKECFGRRSAGRLGCTATLGTTTTFLGLLELESRNTLQVYTTGGSKG